VGEVIRSGILQVRPPTINVTSFRVIGVLTFFFLFSLLPPPFFAAIVMAGGRPWNCEKEFTVRTMNPLFRRLFFFLSFLFSFFSLPSVYDAALEKMM